MNMSMKKFAAVAIAALAFAGCSSYSEIARWDSKIPVNDGEVPVASFLTQNFSYQLFWCVPLCTGLPWTKGAGEDWIEDRFNVSFFSDEATLDNNLATLNHALNLAGSRRIAQLRSVEDDSCWWSLLFVNRHEVRTSCLILPELPKEEKKQ